MTMTKEKAHAKLSASGSAKWLNCPGSVEAESKTPNSSSAASEEGTLAHELADMCLSANLRAEYYIGHEISCESNGKLLKINVTAEMANFVQEYLDYVLAHETNSSQLYTEDKVDFSHVVPKGFGTMDAAILNHITGVCHIFDLKYGFNKVEAENNTQALLYCSGLYNEMKALDLITSFVIHIVQPRVFNFSSWEVSLEELEEFEQSTKTKAKEALKPNAKRIPGDKQCQWCNAKDDCPALLKFTEDTISAEFDDLTLPEVNSLSDEKLKQILDNTKLIETFLEAVNDRVYDNLISGKKLEGYKLVEGKTNRKWVDDAEGIVADKLGEDAYKKTLIGITVGDKLLGKEVMKELTYKPEGKPTMVVESDKRAEITDIAEMFEKL